MIIGNKENAYDKIYNVEFYYGNGKIGTFSSCFVNSDDRYFYFENPCGGLDIIEQTAIRTMIYVKERPND